MAQSESGLEHLCSNTIGYDVLSISLNYLDVVSLVDKKLVSRQWKECCEIAINRKQEQKKALRSNSELRMAVEKYLNGNTDDVETIVKEYGYPIGKWDVSKLEDFSYLFHNVEMFDEDIGSWNVANAINMKGMFCGAAFLDQKNLSNWDVSKVQTMEGMFSFTTHFDGYGISDWDTSSVTDMRCMFHNARDFNGDISAWDVSGVTNMAFMFKNAVTFSGNLSGWNVSRDCRLYRMFDGAINFDSESTTNWAIRRID